MWRLEELAEGHIFRTFWSQKKTMEIEVPERPSSKVGLKEVQDIFWSQKRKKFPVWEVFWVSKSTPNVGTLFEVLLAPFGTPARTPSSACSSQAVLLSRLKGIPSVASWPEDPMGAQTSRVVIEHRLGA